MEGIYDAASSLVEAMDRMTTQLEDIRDGIGSLHNAVSELSLAAEEIRTLRRVQEQMEETLRPLHHLSKLGDILERLSRF